VAIASQQPVAHDLRDIVADMRIAVELERMGDYASDIASNVLELDGGHLEVPGLADLLAMSGLCLLTDMATATPEYECRRVRSLSLSPSPRGGGELSESLRDFHDNAVRRTTGPQDR